MGGMCKLQKEGTKVGFKPGLSHCEVRVLTPTPTMQPYELNHEKSSIFKGQNQSV